MDFKNTARDAFVMMGSFIVYRATHSTPNRPKSTVYSRDEHRVSDGPHCGGREKSLRKMDARIPP